MEIKPIVQEVFDEIFPLIQKETGQDVHLPDNAHRTVLLQKVKALIPDAYEELKAQLDDADQQGFLRIQLKKTLEKQEDLQQELIALLENIKRAKPSPTTGNISNSKNVIQGSTISVGGNFRLGDDIHVSGNNVRIGDEIMLQVFQNKEIDEVIDHLGVQMNISESNRLKDHGRFKIQDFGKEATRTWSEHAWQLLGQALGYFTESIGKNPKNQQAWTNLAYTYYLIGEKAEADRCLEISKSLADPGPNYPGRHYKSVERAIRSGRTIHGAEINRSPRPAWFDEKHLR